MYVKVQELVYATLEIMVHQHSDFFVAIDPQSGMFGQLLRIILRGLQVKSAFFSDYKLFFFVDDSILGNKNVMNSCCVAVDKLLSRHLNNFTRGQQGMSLLHTLILLSFLSVSACQGD